MTVCAGIAGDSLLFAAGAFATPGSPLSFPVVLAVFLVAAILGDAANYAIGSYLGECIQLPSLQSSSVLLSHKIACKAHHSTLESLSIQVTSAGDSL